MNSIERTSGANGYRPTLAFIVPTKDRREDLAALLDSFRSQTARPDQIVIVDGGDEPVADLIDSRSAELRIDYLTVRPPGFTKQKNAGTAALGRDIQLVGYLDDDIILEPTAVEQLLDFWSQADPDVGGTQLHITNMQLESATAFTRFFGTNDGRGGTITSSGFNVVLWPVTEDSRVEWLSGGATVWRRELVDTVAHDEWFAGYGHMDDVDYSIAVGAHWRMYVLAAARCVHNERPIREDREFAFGVYDTVTRHHLVRKYPDRFSVSRWYWATLGKLAGRLARGLLKRDRTSRLRAKGYAAGLWRVIIGGAELEDSTMK